MKHSIVVTALLASPAFAYPQGNGSQTQSNNGTGSAPPVYSNVCYGAFNTPKCCVTQKWGFIDVNCTNPSTQPVSTSNFKSICAASGLKARCCVTPGYHHEYLCKPLWGWFDYRANGTASSAPPMASGGPPPAAVSGDPAAASGGSGTAGGAPPQATGGPPPGYGSASGAPPATASAPLQATGGPPPGYGSTTTSAPPQATGGRPPPPAAPVGGDGA